MPSTSIHGICTQEVVPAGLPLESAPSWLDVAALVQGAQSGKGRSARMPHLVDPATEKDQTPKQGKWGATIGPSRMH